MYRVIFVTGDFGGRIFFRGIFTKYPIVGIRHKSKIFFQVSEARTGVILIPGPAVHFFIPRPGRMANLFY